MMSQLLQYGDEQMCQFFNHFFLSLSFDVIGRYFDFIFLMFIKV